MYSEFREDENATIVIKYQSGTTLDNNNRPIPTYTEAYNGAGIFYELSASEKIARDQIQKKATGQVILDPLKLTTQLDETMDLFLTTADATNKKYRIVTETNPLNRNEAVIIDIIEN